MGLGFLDWSFFNLVNDHYHPSDGVFSKLCICYEHLLTMCLGPEAVMLRDTFWVVYSAEVGGIGSLCG